MTTEFWIIAGINGAGKSTVAQGLQEVIGQIAILNPDLAVPVLQNALKGITQNEANLAAVIAAEAIVSNRILSNISVGIETVLSTRKFETHLQAARAANIITGMIYVCVESVELAMERVRIRTALGGHSVPDEKIRERWSKSLNNAVYFLKNYIDVGYIVTNSNRDGDSRIAGIWQKQRIDWHDAHDVPLFLKHAMS